MPTASDEPKESSKTACGICFNKPSLVSWLHITPDDVMAITEDRSYLPGLASSSASIGLAKASPTMTMALTPSRDTVDHSSATSKWRVSRGAMQPAPVLGVKEGEQPGARRWG